jgi:hypothetical protein
MKFVQDALTTHAGLGTEEAHDAMLAVHTRGGVLIPMESLDDLPRGQPRQRPVGGETTLGDFAATWPGRPGLLIRRHCYSPMWRISSSATAMPSAFVKPVGQRDPVERSRHRSRANRIQWPGNCCGRRAGHAVPRRQNTDGGVRIPMEEQSASQHQDVGWRNRATDQLKWARRSDGPYAYLSPTRRVAVKQ